MDVTTYVRGAGAESKASGKSAGPDGDPSLDRNFLPLAIRFFEEARSAVAAQLSAAMIELNDGVGPLRVESGQQKTKKIRQTMGTACKSYSNHYPK